MSCTRPQCYLPSALLLVALVSTTVRAAEEAKEVPAPQAKKPDVLFIAVDDLKPLLGCYGASFAKTPNLDRLARSGTYFTKAYCQQALCGPTRLSLLTGRYPDVNGIYNMSPGLAGRKSWLRPRHPEVKTLPQFFRESGYDTLTLGKIFDPRNFEKGVDQPSWTRIVKETDLSYPKETGAPASGYQDPQTKQRIRAAGQALSSKGVSGENRDERNKLNAEMDARPVVESADVPDNAYFDGQLGDWGVQQLQAHAKDAAGKPLFLALGFLKPHLPFVAPKKYWDLYDPKTLPLAAFQQDPEGMPALAHLNYNEAKTYGGVPQGDIPEDIQRRMMHGYMACVSYVDAQIGKVLDTLAATGLDQKTIVVVWGDHGWHLGDHGIWGKHTLWEQATHSTLLLRAPGFPANGACDSLCEFVDIYPTLCDLAGLNKPESLDGKSLIPLLKDPAATTHTYAASQYPRVSKEGSYLGYAIRSGPHRYIAWFPVKSTPAGAYRIVGPMAGAELYDYSKDADERRNLSGVSDYVDVEKSLRETLMQHVEYCQSQQLKVEGR